MNPVFFLSLMNGAAWGGSEELWYCTALWMAKHGYKVGIGCYDWEEKKHRIEELKKNGCNIYLLPNRKGLFKKAAIKKALLSIPFDEYALTVVNQGGWEEILHPNLPQDAVIQSWRGPASLAEAARKGLQRNPLRGLLHRSNLSCIAALPGRSNSREHYAYC